jgi:hypothetical protein
MHLPRRILATLVIPALILATFAVSGAAAGGPNGKVTICHWANHKYVEITVSSNALPAHMAHGDVMPDQYGACP